MESKESSYVFADELLNKKTKMSPLYTSPRDAEYKKKFISNHGRDSDGAFRVAGRIDGKK